MAKWIKRRIAAFRAALHRRAEKLRIETWGHQEQMRAQGFPDDHIRRWGEPRLAWADVLDALAGQLGQQGTT